MIDILKSIVNETITDVVENEKHVTLYFAGGKSLVIGAELTSDEVAGTVVTVQPKLRLTYSGPLDGLRGQR